MPDGLYPYRNEIINNGQTVYKLTGVVYGDDGITNLQHFIPIGESGYDDFPGGASVTITRVFDGGISRLSTRVTSTAGGAQNATVRKAFIIPNDFGSFPTGALVLKSRRSSSAPTHLQLTVEKGGTADPSIGGVDIQAVAGLTWEVKTITPTAVYFPGDHVVIAVESQTNANAQFNEVAELELLYTTARGNVE